jgi:hypothetical protein
MSSIAGLKNFHIQSIEEEAHRFTLKSPDGKETQFTLKTVDEKTGPITRLAQRVCQFYSRLENNPSRRESLRGQLQEIEATFTITPLTPPPPSASQAPTPPSDKTSPLKAEESSPPPVMSSSAPLPPSPPPFYTGNPSGTSTFSGPHVVSSIPFDYITLSASGKGPDLDTLPLLLTAYDVSYQEAQEAAQIFSLDVHSGITFAEGVLQDPTQHDIGSGFPPIATGLSAAIHQVFSSGIDPIPAILPTESTFNPNPSAQRLLHTYSPDLSSCGHIGEVIPLLSQSYYSALSAFLNSQAQHGQTTLNLCALSATRLAGGFAEDALANHLDPALITCAVTLAIAYIRKDNPQAFDGSRIVLHMLGDALLERSVLADSLLKSL